MNDRPNLKAGGELVSERLIGVCAYWSELAKGRIGPKREEITPAGIRAMLPSVWMMDVAEQGKDFRFRFAGDRIVQFMGRRYAGHLLSEFQGQPFFDGMTKLLATSVAQKLPIGIGPMPSTHEGRGYLEFEAVALPVSEDGENVTAIFGAFETWPLGTHSRG
jgi:hypothetical protein